MAKQLLSPEEVDRKLHEVAEMLRRNRKNNPGRKEEASESYEVAEESMAILERVANGELEKRNTKEKAKTKKSK